MNIHEYEPGEAEHPMHTDPLCAVCGLARTNQVHDDPTAPQPPEFAPVHLADIEVAHARFLDPGTYRLYRGTYTHDLSMAIMLMDTDGNPAATCSVNLAERGLPTQPRYCWIKTWAENEGLIKDLRASGYLVDPVDVPMPINVGDHGAVAYLMTLAPQNGADR